MVEFQVSPHDSAKHNVTSRSSPRKPISTKMRKGVLQHECRKRRLVKTGTRQELIKRLKKFDALPPLASAPLQDEETRADVGRRSMQDIWLRKSLVEMRNVCETLGISSGGGRFELAGRLADEFRRKGLKHMGLVASEDEPPVVENSPLRSATAEEDEEEINTQPSPEPYVATNTPAGIVLYTARNAPTGPTPYTARKVPAGIIKHTARKMPSGIIKHMARKMPAGINGNHSGQPLTSQDPNGEASPLLKDKKSHQEATAPLSGAKKQVRFVSSSSSSTPRTWSKSVPSSASSSDI